MNQLLETILNEYKSFNQVQAIAIGGSTSANICDSNSDIDIYIFVSDEIPIDSRLNLTQKYSSKFEVGGEYFGAGDEYFVEKLNTQLDVMYWNVKWFEQVIENVLEKHYPSNGYTTCFLYTLKNFEIIYDPAHWLQNLQTKLNQPYPEKLKENIIKRNMNLLVDKPFASYYEQIQKAIKRDDIVSINHRIAAFLASYFDILFAKNELLHPGEKRLIKYAKENCKILPVNFEQNLVSLLNQPPSNDTLKILTSIVYELKQLF